MNVNKTWHSALPTRQAGTAAMPMFGSRISLLAQITAAVAVRNGRIKLLMKVCVAARINGGERLCQIDELEQRKRGTGGNNCPLLALSGNCALLSVGF
jgi:hypothetical protein